MRERNSFALLLVTGYFSVNWLQTKKNCGNLLKNVIFGENTGNYCFWFLFRFDFGYFWLL